MQYQAILFDMDGTLLPMDQAAFTRAYFAELAKALAPYGVTPKNLVAAVWAGTAAMVKNDGGCPNEKVFWAQFEQTSGLSAAKILPAVAHFYSNEFHNARHYTAENPLATKAVRLARDKAKQVVLATNPIFPMSGQRTRMGWVGLTPENFDLVTSYEKDRYCKPNPDYYRDICARIGAEPKNCLMIGNDEQEDMYAASSLGMDCYLVTDCVIPYDAHPWQGARGTFAELCNRLETL